MRGTVWQERVRSVRDGRTFPSGQQISYFDSRPRDCQDDPRRRWKASAFRCVSAPQGRRMGSWRGRRMGKDSCELIKMFRSRALSIFHRSHFYSMSHTTHIHTTIVSRISFSLFFCRGSASVPLCVQMRPCMFHPDLYQRLVATGKLALFL